MTIKQRLMKLAYPLISFGSATINLRSSIKTNHEHKLPYSSIYLLGFVSIAGDVVSMSVFEGKKVLVVNTASGCGYTGQLAELQQLHERLGEKLVVIGFPSNDFKEQEKASNADIAAFCKLNYNVTFLLAQKTGVTKGNEQHPIFCWLTDARQNGWNNDEPTWNFNKYLIDEAGVLTAVFETAISPLAKKVLAAIEK